MEYTFFVLLQRIAKKMLLEEIKANLSSEEDASSDEESSDGKKKKGKLAKNINNSGKHLIEKQIFLTHFHISVPCNSFSITYYLLLSITSQTLNGK